ncbi:phage tail protein [Mergibacter septicus]|uniref:phage late control D family protein n=1 Tax=Mergibacter septicus TaxID=221402 RepID=UPI001C75CFD3|nr:phage late control D family protein [Mergibacter septicus]QDJ13062.1 phage tail protein [Mergibacter septicus]
MDLLSNINKTIDQRLNHDTPLFKVIVTSNNGTNDITQILSERLISLSLTDNRGFEADMLELTLSDHDNQLAFPSRGAIIKLELGWKTTGLVEKGEYKVDELEYSGAPDALTIRARSADLFGSLTTKQERSFHQIKIADLIKQLAEENKLKPLVDKNLGSQQIEHLDQQNESTINLLSRLAQDYDAISTVKNGCLMFIKAGEMKTASGKPLPEVEISRAVGDSFRFSLAESENYKAVRAYWHNQDNGKKGEVIIDENSKIERKNKIKKDGEESKQKHNNLIQTKRVTTDTNQIKTLSHVFKYRAKAITAAKAAFDKLKRGVATFSLTLAKGNPELIPELPAKVTGFKTEIDDTKWIITKVTHSLSESGYSCGVEFELRGL